MGDYLLRYYDIQTLQPLNIAVNFYPGPMSRNNRDFVRDSTVTNTCLS